MNEVIDESEVLDWRKGPLINPFRMAKGDITGKVTNGRMTAAWIEDGSIARQLIAEGFLEEYHLAYGLTLLELRRSSLGHLDAKLNILADLMGGGMTPRRYAARMYGDIIRELKIEGYDIIEEACNVPYYDMRAELKNVYRVKFELLVRITDRVIAEIKKEIDKFGLANE